MWLPKPFYEALPWILLFAGGVLGAIAYFAGGGWLQSVTLLGGAAASVAGLVLLLKRRDYRMSRSRIKYDHLD